MPVFAVLDFFITVFIVQTSAGVAGDHSSADFVVLSAALLAAGVIVAGATPMVDPGGVPKRP